MIVLLAGCGNGPPNPSSSTSPAATATTILSLADLSERLGHYGRLDVEDSEDTAVLQASLKALADADLETLLRQVASRSAAGPACELCLMEAVRRGGTRWIEVIQDILNQRAARLRVVQGRLSFLHKMESIVQLSDEQSSLVEEQDRLTRNLPLQTALRRLQKSPDPLLILVPGLAEREVALGRRLPIEVWLVNVDSERQPATIMWGGDYRSGRPARWRMEATDARGAVLPEKSSPDMMGGGMYSVRPIAFGESFTAELDISYYVDIDEPGEYTLRILYSDSAPIADLNRTETLDGLVLYQSLPIRLTVLPIKIQRSEAQQADTEQWIGRLPADGKARVLVGDYNPSLAEVADFIPPDTAAGRLLALGWPAVPQLIAASIVADTPPVRRAWILGLLYCITGRNDPTQEAGVLGDFEHRYSGSWTMGGPEGGGMAGFVRRSVTSVDGTIDPAKQQNFARRWLPWIEKGYIEVAPPAR
jgi:hypothetical protein